MGVPFSSREFAGLGVQRDGDGCSRGAVPDALVQDACSQHRCFARDERCLSAAALAEQLRRQSRPGFVRIPSVQFEAIQARSVARLNERSECHTHIGVHHGQMGNIPAQPSTAPLWFENVVSEDDGEVIRFGALRIWRALGGRIGVWSHRDSAGGIPAGGIISGDVLANPIVAGGIPANRNPDFAQPSHHFVCGGAGTVDLDAGGGENRGRQKSGLDPVKELLDFFAREACFVSQQRETAAGDTDGEPREHAFVADRHGRQHDGWIIQSHLKAVGRSPQHRSSRVKREGHPDMMP